MTGIDTLALTAKRVALRAQWADLIKAQRFEEAASVEADIERIDAIVC
jgi:protein-arginine kinase activator protein McsA